jgi:chaperonin GroES
MRFKPLHDRVVIEPLDREEKTAGGIIVPDTAQEKPMRGKVLVTGPGACGEDGALLPMEVKRGDTVLYGKFSGTEVKIDDNDVLIMREGDVMGIIG